MITIKPINILFRFDDFLLKETEYQNDLLTLFENENIPLLLGVIPFSLENAENDIETERIKKLIGAGKICIALHGYKHVNNSKTPNKSEFSGLVFDKQIAMIKEGELKIKQILGIKPVVFIPPFNTADINTFKALKKCNFRTVSSSGVYNNPYLHQLPATTTLSEIDSVLLTCEELKNEKYIVVLFHEYECNDLNNLGRLIKSLKNKGCYFPTYDEINAKLEKSLLLSNLKGVFEFKSKSILWNAKSLLKRIKNNI